MKLISKLRIEIMVAIAIMFVLSFVPQLFETVFFETVQDCKYMICPNSPHKHWTSQHFIWTWGGVFLFLFQIVSMVIKVVKHIEDENT